MPTYVFQDTNTGEEWEEIMTIADREVFLEVNSHIKPLIVSANIVSSVEGQRRMDGGFKEVMSKIAEEHPNSPLAETYGSKSIKDVKTREAVKKWRKKRQQDSS